MMLDKLDGKAPLTANSIEHVVTLKELSYVQKKTRLYVSPPVTTVLWRLFIQLRTVLYYCTFDQQLLFIILYIRFHHLDDFNDR